MKINDVIILSFFYFRSNFKLYYSPFSGQNHSCTYTYSLLVALFCFISALLSYVKQNGQRESIDINVQRRCFLWGIEELGSSYSSYKYIKYLKFSPFIGIHSVSLVRPVQQIQDQKLIIISVKTNRTIINHYLKILTGILRSYRKTLRGRTLPTPANFPSLTALVYSQA